jgi:hypothetical protein
MFIVYYRNDLNKGKVIRPTPLVFISYNANRNKDKVLGGDYSITLNGTLLSRAGSPINDEDPDKILSIGPDYTNNPNGDYKRPNKQSISNNDKAYSIFSKQQALRALFAHDGQRMEFSSIRNDEPMFYFYPSLESMSFEEGTYLDFCRYTINLTAPMIFNNDNKPIDLSTNLSSHISDYSDVWSIEVDDSFGKTNPGMDSSSKLSMVPKFYRVTRNVSANGKTVYINNDRYEAWEQARNFIKKDILQETAQKSKNTITQLPPSGYSVFGSGIFDIPSIEGSVSPPYIGFNHIRSENIDKTAGTYSLSDSWILAPSGQELALENYEISTSKSQDSAIQSVSINGVVKGLSLNNADDFINQSKYDNALNKFKKISNNLDFGINSSIFKRAKKMILPEHTRSTNPFLNPIPNSTNITHDTFNGEIKYDLSYDTRPLNFLDGLAKEDITITDTYPGDVYSIIPVINSFIGPLFQYTGGRTEYKRNLNIDITVFRSNIHYNRGSPAGLVPPSLIKESYIYSKPSMSPKFANKLKEIVVQCSPSGEPNIRKYFVDPISETWDARTGEYSLQISWIYEIDR